MQRKYNCKDERKWGLRRMSGKKRKKKWLERKKESSKITISFSYLFRLLGSLKGLSFGLTRLNQIQPVRCDRSLIHIEKRWGSPVHTCQNKEPSSASNSNPIFSRQCQDVWVLIRPSLSLDPPSLYIPHTFFYHHPMPTAQNGLNWIGLDLIGDAWYNFLFFYFFQVIE